MEDSQAAGRSGAVLFWVGTIGLAINLRLGVASVPPLLPEIGRHFGLGTIAQSVLTATPVICFGAFSGLGLLGARRLGDEATLCLAIASLAFGLGLRVFGASGLLFVGTVLMGAATAVMNVLLLSLIKRRESRHAGTLIGAYLVALSLGATAATALAVPIASVDGHAVRLALGIWALPAVAALVLWLPQLGNRTIVAQVPGEVRVRELLRRSLAWQVTGFMGLQSFCYFATLSWLPTLLQDRHVGAAEAGDVTALLTVGSMIGSFTWSWLAGRRQDHRGLIAPVMLTCATAIVGLLWAPAEVAWLCALVLGVGQGASLALPLYFMIARTSTPAAAASLSSMAQGFGYLIASLGPFGVGVIHAATGSWRAGFGLILAATALEWLLAHRAARPVVL